MSKNYWVLWLSLELDVMWLTSFNILEYADDVVLIAPSWRGLRSLMSLLCKHAVVINMSVNKNKTVCMMFKPKNRNRIVVSEFPRLMMDDHPGDFVKTIKYLGHIIHDRRA